jgi:hypothetical protein
VERFGEADDTAIVMRIESAGQRTGEGLLESLWNDRRARMAALLLVVGGAVLLALEAPPITAAVVDMIGVKWVVLGAFGLILGAVLFLFPGWWPLWRARRAGLPDAWVFALVTWGFTTAALQTVMVIVLVPLACFNVFFVPQLDEMGVLSARDWSFVRYVVDDWWIALPLMQVIATVAVTRVLARRWRAIDRAMRGEADLEG